MNTPKVGIIMGSHSDLETMVAAEGVFKEFGVPYELDAFSAHRTPDKTAEYARTARSRGLRVIIAGAGGAAHLPGVVAAYTTLPVIGVPVQSRALGGIDSLYSIVQMPPGVPVACVGIGSAKNAGLLAVEILATSDDALAAKLEAFRASQAAAVEARSAEIRRQG